MLSYPLYLRSYFYQQSFSETSYLSVFSLWPFFFFLQVFHDDDAIPGWEGKIVAWVEEDRGEN